MGAWATGWARHSTPETPEQLWNETDCESLWILSNFATSSSEAMLLEILNNDFFISKMEAGLLQPMGLRSTRLRTEAAFLFSHLFAMSPHQIAQKAI